jgi:hypothetical protein
MNNENIKRLTLKNPTLGKAKLVEDPQGSLVDYTLVMSHLAEDLLRISRADQAMAALQEELATSLKDQLILKSQVSDMTTLLEKAMETIQGTEGREVALAEQLEKVTAATDQTLINMPNLKPIEEMVGNAHIGKSALEVWAQAVWNQMSEEVKTELVSVYMGALVDPETLEAQLGGMMVKMEAEASNLSQTPPVPSTPDLSMEEVEKPVVLQQSGSTTAPKD